MQNTHHFYKILALGTALTFSGAVSAQEQAGAMLSPSSPIVQTVLIQQAQRPSFDTRALHEAMGTLEDHGLRGGYYQAELKRIHELYDDEAKRAEREWSLVREMVADLRYGLGRSANAQAKEKRATELDRLTESLAACTDMADCLQEIAVRDRQYIPLQLMLKHYRDTAKQGGWPSVSAGGKLEIGMQGERVAQVAALLEQTGDYQANGALPREQFHAELEAGVKAFQARHGLEADGVIGGKTLAAMNTPVEKRIEQIELSMDRLRQLPDQPNGEYIRVNIPSYRLQAYQGDAVALSMDVIVGQVSRKTPLFENHITSMVVNPTWTPTPRIIREDILPKVRANPGYLSGSYVVTDNYTGEQMDPYSVDWSSVGVGDVRIMQRSGSGNALGKVKFDMPSSDAIYLHDTSKPYLFKEAFRALSSGCVRVAEPAKLFEFVSKAQGETFAQKAAKHYSGTSNSHLKLERPIPVTTTYFTAWVNDKGKIEFYGDVYQRDAQARLAWNKQGGNQFVSR